MRGWFRAPGGPPIILQQLVLHDFGLFRGKQTLDLSPVTRQGKSRPLVLVGSINGGGKTTLFDAIQLALRGLARAAARPLPAVIDTPMARLDAVHRQNLVERYFPSASHQVVVFSTDTEVDRPFYEALKPHLARAYHLNYDEQTKQTVAEEGYFWRE